jgi:predicted metal-dependent enzyme (double-stranded beta helix superfamily)
MSDRLGNGDSFARYISGIRSLWGDGKSAELPSRVAALMAELLATAGRDEPWMAHLIKEAKVAKELYRDPEHGFIQMGHVQPTGHNNPPHDHGPCWVVYGAYSGSTEIVLYRRADEGQDELGRTLLEKKAVHQLTPGVVYPYLPGDIHSVVALEGPAIVFRFLSYDLTKVKRGYYDLERNATVVDRSVVSRA